jgi:hypothetical protein
MPARRVSPSERGNRGGTAESIRPQKLGADFLCFWAERGSRAKTSKGRLTQRTQSRKEEQEKGEG